MNPRFKKKNKFGNSRHHHTLAHGRNKMQCFCGQISVLWASLSHLLPPHFHVCIVVHHTASSCERIMTTKKNSNDLYNVHKVKDRAVFITNKKVLKKINFCLSKFSQFWFWFYAVKFNFES